MSLLPMLFGSRSRSTRRGYGRSSGMGSSMMGGNLGRAALMGLAAYGIRKYRGRSRQGQIGQQPGIPTGVPGAFDR